MPRQTIIQYGSDQPLPLRVKLRAGGLSMIYEAGELRYVRTGQTELVRRWYVAVRNQNWETAKMSIRDETVIDSGDSFAISYTIDFIAPGIDYVAQTKIKGTPDSVVCFDFHGESRSSFLRNRIGFCVLHPPATCSGHSVRVKHPDGSITTTRFPSLISPHQLFTQITSLEHDVPGGGACRLNFAGDVFETEDQRNWYDASFKTYCTPLGVPFPLPVAIGDRVHQTVTLSTSGLDDRPQDEVIAAREMSTSIKVDASHVVPMVSLGLGVSSVDVGLSQLPRDQLRRLRLAHIRVDLRLGEAGWKVQLSHGLAQAISLGVAIELVIFVTPHDVLRIHELARLLKPHAARLARVIVNQNNARAISHAVFDEARQILQPLDVPVGGGSDFEFVDVNRSHPSQHADFVSFSVNPQVHAFDNASLVETASSAGDVIRTARSIAPNKPVVVSPITLKRRTNPDAAARVITRPGELPTNVDPRQMSLFAAGWTLATLKHWISSGAASLTLFETTGWRGVIESDNGCDAPLLFHSEPAQLFPVFHLLEAIAGFESVISSTSGDPLWQEVLVVASGDRVRVLVANLTDEPRQIELPRGVVAVLDHTTAASGFVVRPELNRCMTLEPFAIVRVDTTLSVVHQDSHP